MLIWRDIFWTEYKWVKKVFVQQQLYNSFTLSLETYSCLQFWKKQQQYFITDGPSNLPSDTTFIF